MNKTKQFWALFKFQASINPFILFMPVAFAMPLFMKYYVGSVGHNYHPTLDLLLTTNQNLFFVGILAAMWLLPEINQFGASNPNFSHGTEFLLTRAIDRPILLRARSVFYYALILTIPSVVLLTALQDPSLQISEYNKVLHQQVLDRLPGSIAGPADKDGDSTSVIIPNGNISMASWYLWVFAVSAVAAQVLIFMICTLKHSKVIFWIIFIGIIFVPLFSLRPSAGGEIKLSTGEVCFLYFATHQLLLWLLTIVTLIASQLWCEHRFANLEQ